MLSCAGAPSLGCVHWYCAALMVGCLRMLMECVATAAGAGDVGGSEQGSAKATPTSSPQKDLPASKPAASKGLVPTKPVGSKASTHAWHPSQILGASCFRLCCWKLYAVFDRKSESLVHAPSLCSVHCTTLYLLSLANKAQCHALPRLSAPETQAVLSCRRRCQQAKRSLSV